MKYWNYLLIETLNHLLTTSHITNVRFKTPEKVVKKKDLWRFRYMFNESCQKWVECSFIDSFPTEIYPNIQNRLLQTGKQTNTEKTKSLKLWSLITLNIKQMYYFQNVSDWVFLKHKTFQTKELKATELDDIRLNYVGNF